MSNREDRTITEFCDRMSILEGHLVKVIERPDRVHHGKGGCDAIILRGDREEALEHTTVDSYKGQREDDARFTRVVVPIEESIRKAFPDSYIWVSVPVHVIPNGMTSKQLEIACIEIIKKVPADGQMKVYTSPNIPFSIRIRNVPSPQNPDCHVMRLTPQKQKAELLENMISLLIKKNKQLKPYKEKGLPTILLLDSDDPSLVSADSLAESLAQAVLQYDPTYIDQIYIVEADRNPIWYLPVKLGERVYPNLPEYKECWRRQYDLIYKVEF